MLRALTSRCYYLPFDPHYDRPSLGVIRGDRFILRVDAGSSPAHAALLAQRMAAANLPPADLIALTHSHWDHTYGMCAASCPVIACRETQAQLQRMTCWEWTLPAMERRLETHEDIRFCHDFIQVEYPDLSVIHVRAADIVFDGRLTIDLGGAHAELIRLENSHADDCVVVHIPEEGVVYLGDICYTDMFHEPECIHRRRYAALRRALEALPFDTAVPGHQLPMSKAALLDDMDESLRACEHVLDD